MSRSQVTECEDSVVPGIECYPDGACKSTLHSLQGTPPWYNGTSFCGSVVPDLPGLVLTRTHAALIQTDKFNVFPFLLVGQFADRVSRFWQLAPLCCNIIKKVKQLRITLKPPLRAIVLSLPELHVEPPTHARQSEKRIGSRESGQNADSCGFTVCNYSTMRQLTPRANF
eukprot:3997971-Amphidinium_carterae.1